MWGKLHLTLFSNIVEIGLMVPDIFKKYQMLCWSLQMVDWHGHCGTMPLGLPWPTGFDFCVQYHFAKEFLSTYVTKCIGNYLTTTATVSKIMRDRETLFTIHYSIYLSLVVPSSPGKKDFAIALGSIPSSSSLLFHLHSTAIYII